MCSTRLSEFTLLQVFRVEVRDRGSLLFAMSMLSVRRIPAGLKALTCLHSRSMGDDPVSRDTG